MNTHSEAAHDPPQAEPSRARVDAFVARTGGHYRRAGRAALERRLVALLLSEGRPMSLSGIAARLGVAKGSLSKLTREMIEAGHLKGHRDFPSRQHLYDLPDGQHTRDLEDWAAQTRALGDAAESLVAQPGLPAQAVDRLRRQAALLGRAAARVEDVLAPSRDALAADLARHGLDWDAMALRGGRDRGGRDRGGR